MDNKNMEVDKEVEMEAAAGTESEVTPVTLIVEEGAVAGGCGVGATDCAKHVVVLSNSDDAAPAAVCPMKWCPHVDEVQKVGGDGTINTRAECADCGNVGDNWVCLSCYKVMCGRFVKEHMVGHSKESGHQLAMSFADLSIWCYACESYVRNEKLFEAFAAAYKDKFNEEPPAGCFSEQKVEQV